jgi:hypothetical protein
LIESSDPKSSKKLIDDEAPPWIVFFFKDFLSDRSFKVRYRGELSETQSPNNGIPQGSPLSPLLFKILFCPPNISEARVAQDFIFMDDYSFIIKSTNLADLQSRSQFFLDQLGCFFDDHNMLVSHDKTRVMFITPESEVSLEFQGQQLQSCEEYRYLGFRFGTRYHEREAGFSTHPQQEYDRCELTKRLGWLKLLSIGKDGMDIQIMREFYIACLRSKISFGILLKQDKAYTAMLENFQSVALRICCGAFKSVPDHVVQTLSSVPPIRELRLSRAFSTLIQIYQANSVEILAEYNFYKENMHHQFYDDSPFGAVFYAEIEMSHKFPSAADQFEFNATIGIESQELFAICHELDVSTTLTRNEWNPPADDPDEFCFYSDGGWDPATGTGAAVAHGDHSFRSNKGIQIPICSSSYLAELYGLELATEEAIEENINNSNLAFVLDCASILSGIQNWCFKHMNQQEIRILKNLQQLRQKGNRVRLRYVPSHLLDEDQWNEFRCRDTLGNRFADSKCSDLLKGRQSNLVAFHFKLTTAIPVITTAMIKQESKRIQKTQSPPTAANEENLFHRRFKRNWTTSTSRALRKLPRREAVTIVRLLSNHHLLRGHFYRLAIKTQARAATREEQCRFCRSQLETPEHILFECEEIQVMEERSECDLANLHYQLPNNEDNLVHLLEDPENWSTICRFFNQLEVEI